ncbi:MAG: hypothetical protein DME22_14275 [Verrucomicrobia bacterium]|nr:MAG: hypothetical protein DME22_14275 [Verrucomicrobiota bacterium]PYK02353.1 MAG: hypothetical protein DME23_01870 [Verrucomicrobiota bacterium]
MCLWLKSNWRERENNSTSAFPGGAALLDFAEAEFCGYWAFHEPSRLRVADPRSGPRLCEAQRFMVPMRDRKVVEATHELYPLIPSFSPSGGEGARRAVEGDSHRFMAPIHVRFLEVFALH